MKHDGKQIRVGLGSRNYGYARVAYDLPVSDTTFKKVAYAPWKLLRKQDTRLANTYLFRPLAKVDLYHLWNGICLNHHPWISTFEAHLPRHPGLPKDWWTQKALERINSADCRQLLPFSDYSRNFFLWQNKGELDVSVEKKLTVFYGALPVDEQSVKKHREFLELDDDTLVITYVGHLFFQKGGVPLLRAFQRLRDKLPRLRLRIISRLVGGDFVTGTGLEEIKHTKKQLMSDDRIEWHEALPNDQVLHKMITSHIGSLASLDDQFPWSPLEAMSRGLPVIVSNITALPEQVVHGVNGYLLDLPKQENRRWIGLALPPDSPERKAALAEAFETLTDGLVKRIEQLYENRELLREMGDAAVERVRTNHDPQTQADKLRSIYQEALG